MLIINVVASEDASKRIVGVIDSEKYNVNYTEELFNELTKLETEFADVSTIEEYTPWVDSVKALIKEADGADSITDACKDLVLDGKTGNYYLKVGNKVSKHPVPSALVEVILEAVEKDLDATPLVKAWTRFLRNPNFSTEKAELFAQYITATIVDHEEVDKFTEEDGFTHEKAVERATYRDVTITNEGLLVTKKYARLLTKGWIIDPEKNEPVLEDLYKTTKTVDKFSGDVTEKVDMPEFMDELTFEPPVQGRSGDSFFCEALDDDKDGKADHIIKVGKMHKLAEWNMVNTNDHTTCVKGLHVGGLQYVDSYKGLNCQLLDCFVDPAMIGAICGLNQFYNSDGAIRVKEYFVYKASTGRTKGIFHSSKYAALNDGVWEDYKKEAIEAANKVQAKDIDFDVN